MIPGWATNIGVIAVDAADQVHLLTPTAFSQASYQSSLTQTNAFTQTLNQMVQIPTDTHQPTLAFQSRLAGLLNGSESHVAVQLSNGASFSKTITANSPSDWHSTWIDLEGLQGQSVTVTFSLIQAANEGLVHWDIDDVSLGSWRTPVITSATQNLAEHSILITGTNFISLPRIYLGDVTLTNTVVLTNGQLRATVPATIQPGHYPLIVENPDGTRGALAASMAIGEAVYLPVLARLPR